MRIASYRSLQLIYSWSTFSYLAISRVHDELQLFRSGGHTVIEVREQLCAQPRNPTLTASARSHNDSTVLTPSE